MDNRNEMDGKYLTFLTDSQMYGIPISVVVQIVSIQNITNIPGLPAYVKGVINLRGSIIPVLDVRLRLNKREVRYDEHTCIIVTSMQKNLYGFIVDCVDEVIKIDYASISIPPKLSVGDTGSYLNGIAKLEKKVVLLLDIEKILNCEQIPGTAQNNI
jgi:purine-binding chemotaxis protein CheW